MRFVVAIFVALVAVFVAKQNQSSTDVATSTTLTLVSPTPSYNEISWQNQKWGYQLAKIEDSHNLKLIHNLEDKLSSDELVNKFHCSVGINGGFYDTSDRPLGWFVSEGETFSKKINSQLFNGFVWQDKTGEVEISQPVEDEAEWILQTGPVLMREGNALELAMSNDKAARRMVLGKATNEVFLITFFDTANPLGGPYLDDLPQIVAKLDQELQLNLQTAINLDGGRASAFFTEEMWLEEMSPVGSWICLKKSEGAN